MPIDRMYFRVCYCVSRKWVVECEVSRWRWMKKNEEERGKRRREREKEEQRKLI